VRSVEVPVGPQEAHVYTECSRIWNPIHTEWSAAEANGLAFLLLHGTATLAKAVSAVDDLWGDGQRRIHRIVSRFAAQVPMPSTLRVTAARNGTFTATLPDGSVALRDSRVFWRQ
jgi:acyl dehydratase